MCFLFIYTLISPPIFIPIFSMVRWLLITEGVYIMLFLPIFFFVYLFTIGKKLRKLHVLALACLGIVALLGIYYLSGHVFSAYNIDDEVLLSFMSIKSMLAGVNPYAMNFTPQLYANKSIGLTVTTANGVMSTMDYPALFFFVDLPFYLLTSGNLSAFQNVGMEAEALVSILIYLISVYAFLPRERFMKPDFLLIAIFGFSVAFVASIQTILMLAVFLLAYKYLDSRYSWLFLGLGFALQEQLWAPFLLLVIYSFIDRGFRKGAQNALGAAAVFLIINGYFILQNPLAFATAVFMPVSRYIIPSGPAFIGFALSTIYPITLDAFGILFLLAVGISAVLFIYVKDKRAVGVFGLLPLLTLSHAISPYYTVALSITIYALLAEDSKPHNFAIKIPPRILALTLATLLAAAALEIYASHAYLLRTLQLTSSQNFFASTSNSIMLGYRITSGNSSVSRMSVFVAGSNPSSFIDGYGLYENDIIGLGAICAPQDYSCKVNSNNINIQNNSKLQLNITLSWDNATSRIYSERVFLYNGKYFYVLPDVVPTR